jgi:predicted nucleotide-binding protein
MIDPDPGIELLAERIARAGKFGYPLDLDAYRGWVGDSGECLVRIFGEEEAIVRRFFNTSARREGESAARTALKVQIQQLESAIEILKAEAKSRRADSSRDQLPKLEDSRKVFVVHGHNEAIKQKAARFLERAKLEPVILAEQAGASLTVIEHFEQRSEVSFAVVILTADDRGGVRNSPPESLQLRARQNVIFELGYFVAKLGRKKVCALYEEGVEIPSDYKGVIFVPLDEAGAWQFKLAQELRNAGLKIDLNKI